MNKFTFSCALFVAAGTHAATNVSIDPKNQFAMITISSNRISPDTAPQNLFDALNGIEETLGQKGTRRGVEGPGLQINCTSVPMAAFANCQVLIQAGEHASFDHEEKEVKYQLLGENAAAMLPFFDVSADGFLRVTADDNRFGLYIDANEFTIKGHPRRLPDDPR